MNLGIRHVRGHAAYLARHIYQHVYDFTVNDLAGILSRCVECKVAPRGPADELAAASIVNQTVLGNPVIYVMGSQLLILKGYDLERRGREESLPPISREIIDRFPEGSWHFDGIEALLGTLDWDRSRYLLDRAAAEICWDHDFTKLVLGRCVWNWMYQPWKGNLPNMYGEVWFE